MNTKELYQLYQEHPCITTDSRDCPEGSIFVALKGDKFDGNQYALKALENGCAYAIVDSEELRATQNDALIFVNDTLQTLKDLAREHRRQFQIPVIGITGTNGKTTTKELIAAVLQKKYNVLYTQGNFNNDVGVPKTLFRLTKEHDIAVIEMGASHPGDIKTLAETAEPTCGLITNVGRAHLQGFGSFKNVVKTKGELYDYLGRRGESLVFLNADNERLIDILPDNVWVAPYSTNPDNTEGCTVGEVTACDPFLQFRWRESDTNLEEREPQWYDVKSQLIGAYNIDNMMAAIAVGLNFGVAPADINSALADYKPSNNRSQLTVTEHNRLVVDAYNANPSSMRAALENFRLMEGGPKMAILGMMGELGKSSHKEHQKIVDLLQQCDFDTVWLVGSEFQAIDSPYRKFTDVEEVKAAIAAEQPQGYHILIKGSNSTRLFQLPELL
jgi:UDP-N-acetylmuramoyl-tripeptide--D-alanyl-D-alanine ligase